MRTKRAVNFTCDQSVYDRLAEIARREHRSVSAQIEYMLARQMDHMDSAVAGSQIDTEELARRRMTR